MPTSNGARSEGGCSWTEEDDDGSLYYDIDQKLRALVLADDVDSIVIPPLASQERRIVHAMAHLSHLGHETIPTSDKLRPMRVFKKSKALGSLKSADPSRSNTVRAKNDRARTLDDEIAMRPTDPDDSDASDEKAKKKKGMISRSSSARTAIFGAPPGDSLEDLGLPDIPFSSGIEDICANQIGSHEEDLLATATQDPAGDCDSKNEWLSSIGPNDVSVTFDDLFEDFSKHYSFHETDVIDDALLDAPASHKQVRFQDPGLPTTIDLRALAATPEQTNLPPQAEHEWSRSQRQPRSENGYICRVEGCGKMLSRASDRNKHEQTHAPEHSRPHPCTFSGCPRKFRYPKDLRRHLKVHDKKARLPPRDLYQQYVSSDEKLLSGHRPQLARSLQRHGALRSRESHPLADMSMPSFTHSDSESLDTDGGWSDFSHDSHSLSSSIEEPSKSAGLAELASFVGQGLSIQ